MPDNVPDDSAPSVLRDLVARSQGGDSSATDRLFTTLYQQLRRMARREAGRLNASKACNQWLRS